MFDKWLPATRQHQLMHAKGWLPNQVPDHLSWASRLLYESNNLDEKGNGLCGVSILGPLGWGVSAISWCSGNGDVPG